MRMKVTKKVVRIVMKKATKKVARIAMKKTMRKRVKMTNTTLWVLAHHNTTWSCISFLLFGYVSIYECWNHLVYITHSLQRHELMELQSMGFEHTQ